MNETELKQGGASTPRMPVIFVGHGSPMNAIETNAYTRALTAFGERIAKPKAILCVSAHWMTEGSWITRMPMPKTIHDFYGFPKELFDVQYPAPGSPQLADVIRGSVTDPQIQADESMWGLDHGTWAVLKHMYPHADIPVLQLSLHMAQPAEYHYLLGQRLAKLRDQGVLIVGSGNIVHNLRRIRWEPDAKPYDWAIEFDESIKQLLLKRDDGAIEEAPSLSTAGKLSVPTLDHYLPLLYVLGASDKRESLKFEHEELQNGAISMRCVSFGA